MGVREVLTHVGTSGTARIAGLVLVEGNLWPQGTLEAQVASIRQMQADRKAFTRDFVRRMYEQPQPEAYFDRVTEMSLKTPTDAAAILMLANAFGADADMRPLFSKIDKPVLFVGVPSKKPQGDALKAVVPQPASNTWRAQGTRCSSIRPRSSTPSSSVHAEGVVARR